MKKIFAIVCCVAVFFTACTQGEETTTTTTTTTTPTYPKSEQHQEFEITSGTGKFITFSAVEDWTLSLDNPYALLQDPKTGNRVTSLSGGANEEEKVLAYMQPDIENYDAYIVFHVLITMGGETETLATFTIKKIDYSVKEYTNLSGNDGSIRQIGFWATQKWKVWLSDEGKDCAYIKFGDREDDIISGDASNQHVNINVYIHKNIESYEKDIVFSVYRQMGNGAAREWARITIKKVDKPESIVVYYLEESATFEKGGHPADGGAFRDVEEKYHLNYSNEYDLEGYHSVCNLDQEVSIKAYAYNSNHELVEASTLVDTTNVEKEEEQPKPWVYVSEYGEEFGSRNFKVVMNVDQADAAWSWNEDAKCFESYVNFVNANDEVLVSIYCTCTYNPATAGTVDPGDVVLFGSNIGEDKMKLEWGNSKYTLTLKDPEVLKPENAASYGFRIKNGGQASFDDGGWETLKVVQYSRYYHVQLIDPSIDPLTITNRDYTITALDVDQTKQYTIDVVLDWVTAPTEE